jgi:hypothetical protein
MEQDMTDEIFQAGYGPAEALANRYLAGGYTHDDMLHALAYSAAAQVFRDTTPQEAEWRMQQTFDLIVSDLVQRGPHYGDEAY